MLLFIVQDLHWKNSNLLPFSSLSMMQRYIITYISVSACACVTSEWVKRLNERLIECVRVRAKRQFAQTRCDSFAGGRPIRDQRLNRTSKARESPWSRIVENGVVLQIRKNLTFPSFFRTLDDQLWTFAFIYVFDHDVAYKWIRDTYLWSIRWRGWDGTWLRKRLPDDGEINHCVTNCCDLSDVSLLRCQTGSIYFGHAGLHRSILDSM